MNKIIISRKNGKQDIAAGVWKPLPIISFY